MQRETKDSSARDPAALREADCHRRALPAVLSSCPTWLGSPEPHWDRESIAPRGRHLKLSLSRRRRGPPSSPAVENQERGGGGPRAGRFSPRPSEPRWDYRGLCGAALPPLSCGRVRRAAPGAAVPLAGPGGAAPRRGAELPAPAQPSPPPSPQPRSSVFVLKRRPSSSLRDGAARSGRRRKGPRLFGMRVFGREREKGRRRNGGTTGVSLLFPSPEREPALRFGSLCGAPRPLPQLAAPG